MDMKKIILIVGLLILIVLILIMTILVRNLEPVELAPDGSLPTGYTAERPDEFIPYDTPTSPFMDIKTTEGLITVRNFIMDEDVQELGGGAYFLGSLNESGEEPFTMSYFAPDQSFAIALLKQPLMDTRVAAEKALQERLGVTEQEMCELSIRVGVPYVIIPTIANVDLGVSYCEGSIEL